MEEWVNDECIPNINTTLRHSTLDNQRPKAQYPLILNYNSEAAFTGGRPPLAYSGLTPY